MNAPSLLDVLDDGPCAWLPAGLSDVDILAGATLGPIPFRVPATRRVIGMRLSCRSGAPADAAKLTFRWVDHDGVDRIYDTSNQTFAAPFLSFGGLNATLLGIGGTSEIMGVRMFPLDVIAPVAKFWNFTIVNNAGVTVTPIVVLYHEPVGAKAARG